MTASPGCATSAATDWANAPRQRIAVVGSGISGLVAAHVLQRRHDVTVFEAADYAGGHTNTIDVEWQGRDYAVDTGFIVFNDRTYPNFIELLKQLRVASQDSDMGFSVRCERTGLEYNGNTLNTLFAQRRNLLRPSFYKMLLEILRFNKQAPRLLYEDGPEITLGEFLQRGRYSRGFIDHYLIPMGAAIWSTPPESMMGFPARYFVQFFHNHGMLTVDDRPIWRVVKGGSRSYVRALVDRLDGGVQCNAAVRSIRRFGDHVEVVVADREPETFDAVVIATHSDTALRMLADPSVVEQELLGAIPYQPNGAVLHVDERMLPKRRLAWAAWNYHLGATQDDRVALTYDMNILQSLDAPVQFLVTLNRTHAIDPDRVLRKIQYHHPVYTREGVAAQLRVDEISGVNRTFYCGAYWGFGFHEDGVKSALAVTAKFGMKLSVA